MITIIPSSTVKMAVSNEDFPGKDIAYSKYIHWVNDNYATEIYDGGLQFIEVDDQISVQSFMLNFPGSTIKG